MSSGPAFHLGRTFDVATRVAGDEPVLYPAEHLVTHGVILGMTGSGKTGLASVLLEEAALAGVPAIAIDPKGDLGNLLLAFPALRAEDFAPYVPVGQDPAVIAERTREGLRASGARLGRPLSLMPSLGAPPPGSGEEGMRDRAVATSAALLSLAGLELDAVRSAEHALVAHVLLSTWSRGQGLELAELLRAIQTPPFERLGVMDLESVVPAKKRQELAVRLNAALASPSMAGLLEGEALDVARLLRAEDGRPRLSILSIAHLSDAERTFFLTALLGEVIAWMRAQEGTSALRAILYMDEIAGFFPPVAMPPTKAPMLTLLKQARAFGLGVVLATQNPVDLDYKGLSNCGTWMLGRLQTERDKLRVLDGLESLESGGLDRASLDAMLSALGPRAFLLHDVHAGPPRAMQTRYAMSYLRGPLSREQLRALSGAPSAPVRQVQAPAPSPRPLLPPAIAESFVVRADIAARAYRPGLAIRASIHYVDAKAGVDAWLEPSLLVPLADEGPRWSDAWWLAQPLSEAREPIAGIPFAALPSLATRAKSYDKWSRELVAHVVKERPLALWRAPELELTSAPSEPADAFRHRAAQHASRAHADALHALSEKWTAKIDKAREKLALAERRAEGASTIASVDLLDAGVDVLGALVGKRRSLRRAGAAAARRTARSGERTDRAREQVRAARLALERLERDFLAARLAVEERFDPARLQLRAHPVRAKRAAVRVDRIAFVWVPSPE